MAGIGRLSMLVAIVAVLALFAVPPFLPTPEPLPGLVPPETLADPDSRFIEVDGVTIHYKLHGEGEPAIVLLHGFTASTYTWRKVASPLAELGTVVAFDRPSSGLTERPLPGDWVGPSPYGAEAQAAQTVGLMDRLGIDRAVLVGNSAGGMIATLVALRYPARVQALVLVDAEIYEGGGAQAIAARLASTPLGDRVGPLIARRFIGSPDRVMPNAWHDFSKLTPEEAEGGRVALKAINWDRGLWELTKAARALRLYRFLDEISAPTLVITGDDDKIIPAAKSIRLAGDIAGAQLVIIPNCGHAPQEECPVEFLEATTRFIKSLE